MTTIKTKYFGEFNDDKDDANIPLQEIIGTVKVHSLNGIQAAFLYESLLNGKGYIKYDLPQWACKYDNYECAVLGRVVIKEVGDKHYKRLVVVRLTPIRQVKAGRIQQLVEDCHA